MRLSQRFHAVLAILTLLPLTLPVQAVDKKQGIQGASNKMASPPTVSRASDVLTGPAHPSLFDPQAGVMDVRPAKTVHKTVSSNRIQLKRYQMKYRYPRTGLRPSMPPGTQNTGMMGHWIAPLPEAGNDYLRGMYAP